MLGSNPICVLWGTENLTAKVAAQPGPCLSLTLLVKYYNSPGLGVGLHRTKIIKLREIQTELKQRDLISCMSHPKRVMICLFER